MYRSPVIDTMADMTAPTKLQQLFDAALRAPEEDIITITRVVPGHWAANPPRAAAESRARVAVQDTAMALCEEVDG